MGRVPRLPRSSPCFVLPLCPTSCVMRALMSPASRLKAMAGVDHGTVCVECVVRVKWFCLLTVVLWYSFARGSPMAGKNRRVDFVVKKGGPTYDRIVSEVELRRDEVCFGDSKKK